MEQFQFRSPTNYILERDAECLAGREAKAYSDRVLLVHYGDDFIRASGLLGRVKDSLESEGITVVEQDGVTPNPTLVQVREGIAKCRKHSIGCIVALGGGSVIDTAKAIGIGALYDGDVWDFYSGKAVPSSSLPVGVVMTLPATGSEGSNGSVITNEATGEKYDVMGDVVRPEFVLMNPLLTYTIPHKQFAYGVADMISHVTERYFSSSVNTLLTDRLCEGVLIAILENTAKIIADPEDFDARADLMWASILAHNGLLGTGRNQDWATHMMGAPLSGEYGAVHGATISVLLPAWAEYVYGNNLPRFVQFANRVFGLDVDFYNQEVTALTGIRCLSEFFAGLGLPSTLPEIGIATDEKFAAMAKEATRFGKIGCIRPLDADDVEAIYRSVL